VAESEHDLKQLAQAATGVVANRRTVLRTATGLAAAAVVGSALADRGRVAVAAGPSGRITSEIEGLGQFEVLAFSWGVSNSGTTHTGGGSGAGQPSFQDVSLTKYTDALTPELMVAIASGEHFPAASLAWSDNSGKPILLLEMEEVLATSLSLGGSSSESALTENLTLNFALVRLTVGDASAGWDIPRNEEI
jgi:type VI secretion system secreted protein Hcp